MCLICAQFRPADPACPYTGKPTAAALFEFFDAAASTATVYTMAVGDTFTGSVGFGGDADWVRITLTAGQTVTIALNGNGTFPLADPYLRLLNAAGAQVAFDDDSGPGLNALVTYTPTTTGTFHIEASAFLFGTGGYRLSVTGAATGGQETADAPATTATPYSLGPGESFRGTLSPGSDRDWVRVELAAGQTYQIELAGDGTNPVRDTFLRLFNANRQLVASNDDFGGTYDSRIVFTPATGGTFYVEASSFNGWYAGGYVMRLVTTGTPPAGNETTDAPATAATPYTLALGGTFRGTLNPANDRDWVAIDVTAGTTYLIDMAGDGTTPVRDTFLRLYNAAGTLVAQNDDHGGTLDSRIAFTATTTGRLYVEASSFNGLHSGGYRVTLSTGVAPPPPPEEVVFTVDQIAEQLTTGFWRTMRGYNGPPRAYDVPDGGLNVNIAALTPAGQQLARWAYDAWTDLVGLRFNLFTTVPAGTTIHIRHDDEEANSAYATSNYSAGMIVSSFVNVGRGWLATSGTGINTYSLQTYIHEIGHALGLGHAGNYNGSATYGRDNHYANDSWQATVMSYFNQLDNTYIDATRAFVLTPMLADLVAIGTLYGARGPLRPGDTTYGDNTNAGGFYAVISAERAAGRLGREVAWTIRDDGGTDTLDLRSSSAAQRVDLAPGSISDVYGIVGNLSIARGTVIENALTGAGNDRVTGNAAANTIDTGAGNDTVQGGDGNDTLTGGEGNDSLMGGRGADRLFGGPGNDTLAGDRGADRLVATAGNTLLRGGEGADTLIAGTGRDTLTGGAGADTFVFSRSAFAGTGAAADVVTDFTPGGGDRIDLRGLGLSFIGGAAFAGGGAAQLRYANGRLAADFDGNGAADGEIVLTGAPELAAMHLLL